MPLSRFEPPLLRTPILENKLCDDLRLVDKPEDISGEAEGMLLDQVARMGVLIVDHEIIGRFHRKVALDRLCMNGDRGVWVLRLIPYVDQFLGFIRDGNVADLRRAFLHPL